MPGNGSWPPFEKGRPSAGRKAGSRNVLSKKFIASLAHEFEESGDAALARLSFQDPGRFLELVARLIPQKLEVTNVTQDISDDRLEELIAAAERMTIEGSAQLVSSEPPHAQPLTLAHNIGIGDVSLAHDDRLGSEPVPLNHEKPHSALVAKEGGGGPHAQNVPSPENRSSSTPDRQTTVSTSSAVEVPADQKGPAENPAPRKRGRPRKAVNPLNEISPDPIDPESLF